MAHVFIEEMRGLLAKEEDGTVDPICQVTTWGQKKYTKQLEDVGGSAAVYLGEHIFFMKSHLEVAEVEKSRVLIEVKDHRFLGKDALIGSYELDVPFIYMQNEHCLKHT